MSDTLNPATVDQPTNAQATLVPIDHAEYAALTTGAAILARPNAGVLRLTDADRHDFLQRMTTNNIAILRPGHSAVTVLTNPTARILQTFTVIARSDDLVLLPAPDQGQALARHLRGQIFFMDKVKVHDLSPASAQAGVETWERLRVMGPAAARTLDALGVEVTTLTANAVMIHDELLIVAQPHYEVPGFELVTPTAKVATATEALTKAGATPISDATYHARRVELGRPTASAELTEDYSPLEAGLAWACAENKGCYTGQEIIARQITYDKVTKMLVGLRLSEAVSTGSEVMVEGRTVGNVTSFAHSPTLDAPIALAIIKRPFNAPGTEVKIGAQTATVGALPLVEN